MPRLSAVCVLLGRSSNAAAIVPIDEKIGGAGSLERTRLSRNFL
jgi:hypothetical protein